MPRPTWRRLVYGAAALLLGGALFASWLYLRPEPVRPLNAPERAEYERMFGHVAPHTVLGRPEPRLESRSLVMRDGIPLAVDLWLPEDLGRNGRVPALVMVTRYWRRTELNPPFSLFSFPDDDVRFFTAGGYAVLRVDARGSGASGGTRAYPWSAPEREDYREIVDWIVAQPWSNGRVGALGVSYVGTSAEFFAALGHPAVRAVMPMFSLYDAFPDIAFPGGVRNDWFIYRWGKANEVLDANELPRGASWVAKLAVDGVAPAGDGPEARAALERAIAQHKANGDIYANALSVTFRDDVSRPAGVSIDTFSPHAVKAQTEAGGAAFSVWAGWHDGAYARAALERFAALDNGQRLVIGPWNHGAEQALDPLRGTDGAGPDGLILRHERLRFFDHYLKDTGQPPSKEIVYYVLGAGEWRRSPVWPPAGTGEQTWWLSVEGGLEDDLPARIATRGYVVDFNAGSGRTNRWRTQLFRSDVRYEDREMRGRSLLVFESPPLEADMELAGTPLLHLRLAVDAEDTAVHAYLEAVSPRGRVALLSEGVLRALHRAAPAQRLGGGNRSFLRSGAAPLVAGRAEDMAVPLLPLAARIPAGWRLRLALGGADSDEFARVPPAGNVTWAVHTGGQEGSRLVLPVAER